MTKTITKTAPFKADHVGSLLRPDNLHEARKDYADGKITASQLREVETKEIKRIVDKQIEVGLELVTDGEFRRRFWHTDFLEHLNGIEGYVPEQGYIFHGNEETERYNVRNIGKISFNPDHPFIKDFIEFNEIVAGRAVAKQTIPSPNQLFHPDIINHDIYPTVEEFTDDVIKAYQDALQAFYDVGVRYLQLDDVYIARLSSPDITFSDDFTRDDAINRALEVINRVLENKPEDLVVTTHLCRGNYRSNWAFEGSYDLIAPTLLAKEKVDGFFLEYDDDRSGDFKPLDHIPDGGAQVVLGVVTSKDGKLEDKDAIKARIKEAAKYLPHDQLCLSPQCGFASTHHGNKLTEEEQWEKLKFIVEVAKEVWG